MAKEQGGGQQGGNVVALPTECPAEGCGKKPKRSAFCEEHFVWFKEGLINRKGERPKDFDKKYMAFQMRQKKKAA
ncbi:MAG: hypothetical protein HRT45_08190 [Bdellovibrionales bacterium]|nr:hypothetical protein [Bdellovibrionales bacterium]